MGHAILTHVGLGELSVATMDAYVTCACDLAHDRDRLRAIRHDLRGRLLASPHMDHRLLGADIGTAFRAMWHRWTEAGPDTQPGIT